MTRAKKGGKSVHVSLPESFFEHRLKPFAESRDKTISDIIRYALERVLEEEGLDYEKEESLKGAVERLFLIPRGYSVRNFWITLVMLAAKYPEQSARRFWSEMFYIGTDLNFTHKQVREDIEAYVQKKRQQKNV